MRAKTWLSRLRDVQRRLDKVLDDIYKGEVPQKDVREKLQEFEKQLKDLKSKLK
jgi:predicted  nucleic acid-binding Zn-ribbon protein